MSIEEANKESSSSSGKPVDTTGAAGNSPLEKDVRGIALTIQRYLVKKDEVSRELHTREAELGRLEERIRERSNAYALFEKECKAKEERLRKELQETLGKQKEQCERELKSIEAQLTFKQQELVRLSNMQTQGERYAEELRLQLDGLKETVSGIILRIAEGNKNLTESETKKLIVDKVISKKQEELEARSKELSEKEAELVRRQLVIDEKEDTAARHFNQALDMNQKAEKNYQMSEKVWNLLKKNQP